jgi:hypothetical protein
LKRFLTEVVEPNPSGTATTPSINAAAASNGGVASASSIWSANFTAAGAINGDRKGLNYNAGGVWADGTTL